MKNTDLDLYVYNIKLNKEKRNTLIKDYQPFIIKIISEMKNGYISVENDEEFAIGLLAFDEAIERFDYEKGHFLSYSKLVIGSRLKNFWEKEHKHNHSQLESYQDMAEIVNEDLVAEIQAYEKELLLFGLDFETLSDHAPKHSDTRKRAKEISRKISRNGIIMNRVYEKKKLPITLISKLYNYSVKVIKSSKIFILAGSIIFYKNYEQLKEWIK